MKPTPAVLFALCLTSLASCVGTPPDVGEDPATLPPASGRGPHSSVVVACEGIVCLEPTIAADPVGRIFVSSHEPDAIRVSHDRGFTWEPREVPPLPATMKHRGNDNLVQVAPSGRLYYSTLITATPVPRQTIDGVGTVHPIVLEGIQVAWSDDGGLTWPVNAWLSPIEGHSEVVSPDRQWLGFGADDTVYVTYNQIPSGIWLSRSDDGGETWTPWNRVIPFEERAAVGLAGPPVVNEDGVVAIAACDQRGNVRLFSSTDDGASFTGAVGGPGCDWFPMTVPRQGGTFDVFHTAGPLTPASESSLRAELVVFPITATRFSAGSAPTTQVWGDNSTTSPWPLTLPDGSMSVTWFRGNGPLSDLVVTFGSVAAGPVRDVVIATEVGVEGSRSSSATDFASAALTPHGGIALVWVQEKRIVATVLDQGTASWFGTQPAQFA